MLALRILPLLAVASAGASPAAPPDSGSSAAERSSAASFIRPEDFRVASVAYRLALAGAPLCERLQPLTGLQMHQLGEYEPRDRPRVIKEHRLDLGPGVLVVLPSSPAARAGLLAGDTVISVNGNPFQPAERAAAYRDSSGQRTALEETETHLEAELARGPVRLDLLRAGQKLHVTVTPVWGCAGRVRLARSEQPNAFADGTYAIMTTKLLSFVRSDDELALVLGHEMAHNILGHPARLRALGVPRGAARSSGKNARRVWATEEEADKLAVKLLAAGGYDLGAVMPFWRRFYANYESRLQLFRTHPSLAARERIFRRAVAELPPRSQSR